MPICRRGPGAFQALALEGLSCEADPMTVSVENRKTFLRKLAAAGLGGSMASVTACRGSQDHADPDGDGVATAELVARPLLLPWSDGVIQIAAPTVELPVAYVSMDRRQVFVDRAFRDRVSWLLDAHLSVSTGLWRIRLPGDATNQPVTPGDESREFEELDIRAWEPTMAPARDDIRIRRGSRISRRVHFDCVPMSGSIGTFDRSRWFSAGPWSADVCDGRAADTTREDFMIVGAGSQHSGRDCEGSGEPVQYIMWACR